jgi:glycosyltransferase involved in cell wall biosynthesis
MDQPIVTLGVCVRNGEQFIGEAINSIIDQDFPHKLMEIIFVDDGSDDTTLSIINDYASKIDIETKIFHHQWKGLGPSRNVVVKNASGKYIIWVDCDMVISKIFVRKQVEFAEKNPKVGIVKGKCSLQGGNNIVATLENFSRATYNLDFSIKEWKTSASLGTGGSVYRVEAIRQIKGFDECIKGVGEDWDAQIRIKNKGWLIYVVPFMFQDYERSRISWGGLWRKYYLAGYSLHHLLHKHMGLERIWEMTPPIAFFSGLFRSFKVYKCTGRKIVFMMPLQFVFKMSAWFFGFVKGHINSYQP